MIEKNNLVFREFIDTDIHFLLELRNDIEIQELLLSRPRPNDKQKLLNWVRSRIDSDTKELFIMADKKTNEPMGFSQLNNIDFINGHCEFGVCVHSNFRKRGIFKNSVIMLEDYALQILNIQKFIGYALENNDISLNTLYKIGYKKVGVFEKHFLFRQQKHNVVIIEKLLH